tara:strand:+ start:3792 stop:4211 length:420 start_codon:yes stop_codon:yes gene_type:complete
MADINRKIRAALETHLSTISGLPDIAYENVPYEPTTGQSFIRVSYMPTVRRPAVRGRNPQQEYRGLLALNVYAPEGSGPAVCEDIVEKLLEGFEATTDITYNDGSDDYAVCIDYAERSIGITDAPWYLIPVNIGWFIYN